MPTVISCFIAGICMTGFLTMWFSSAYKEMSFTRDILEDLEEQLRLHQLLFNQAKGSPDERAALNMLETSRMLFCEAAKGYNRILNKPMNRFPALLMGFRTVDVGKYQGYMDESKGPL